MSCPHLSALDCKNYWGRGCYPLKSTEIFDLIIYCVVLYLYDNELFTSTHHTTGALLIVFPLFPIIAKVLRERESCDLIVQLALFN